jgi:hypothetical protein
LERLEEKGNSQELILKLANDAQTWSDFRKILKTQTRTAKEFTENYYRMHNKGQGNRDVERYIEKKEHDVLERIDRLDQAIRDLLQIVSTRKTSQNVADLCPLGICMGINQ